MIQQSKHSPCGEAPAIHSIGIFGGTYDPVHYGHLRTASEIKEYLGLSELRLVPCGSPPHREQAKATAAQRLKMLELAVEEFPELTIDDSELNSPNISYTFHTINHLLEQHPKAQLFLMMGVDAFEHFTQWYQWRKILQRCHIVVLCRPGYQLSEAGDVRELLARHRATDREALKNQPCGRILIKELNQYPISATDIRTRIADNQSFENMLPEKQACWIKEHQLYRSPNTKFTRQ